MSAIQARRVVVRGHVQGVFFRDSVRREAARRGVSGWVANRSDGSVEAFLEGAAESVGQLVDFCRRGPRGAEVTDVAVAEEAPRGLDGFGVR